MSPPTHAELVRSFLKISLLGFGGPNAHLALMLDEVVERRGWLTREHFLQLVGVTNLLPGPNSSEVAIHVGYTQRGWTGALATGLTFLLPTFVMVTGLSWLYFGYGSLPRVESVFWGLKPAVLGLIVWAGLKLGRTAVAGALLWLLAAAGAVVSAFAGGWVVVAMVVGGLVTWLRWRSRAPAQEPPFVRPPATDDEGRARETENEGRAGRTDDGGRARETDGLDPERDPGGRDRGDLDRSPDGGAGDEGGGLSALALAPLAALAQFGTLLTVLWTHLWIGAVLFGGGYVLVVLLEPQAVERYGWLTSAQFLDGVALTQAVPGPISTLSAFVGYAAGGLPGAVLATTGVYLPAFVAVLLVAPHLERLRSEAPVKAALEGVSAVVAGAIVGVAVVLYPAAVPDIWAAALLVGAFLALWRFGLGAPWVVGGGLLAGLAKLAVG